MNKIGFLPRFVWGLLLLFSITIISCGNDSGLNRERLVGKWKCVDGLLNGKPQGPQGMVTGFQFEFTDKAFVSNILEQLQLENNQAYDLKDNKIIMTAHADVFFTVDEYKDGALKLGLDANGTSFQFHLQKQ